MENNRKKEYNVDDLFINRWSPRSMIGENISKEKLMMLFEAAKWAPSSYNGQPWRFIYVSRDSEKWNNFFNLLVDFNKQWCKNASVLFILVSKKHFDHNGELNAHHTFDSGSAWMSLALQASKLGLVSHGMAGFDVDGAAKMLNLSDEYKVEMMGAIGVKGERENLPKEMQESEKPNGRKQLNEIVFEEEFRP